MASNNVALVYEDLDSAVDDRGTASHEHLLSRGPVRLIPFQSGEEHGWERWMGVLQTVSKINNWSEDEKVQATYDSLTGDALGLTLDLERPAKGTNCDAYLNMLGRRFPAKPWRERMQSAFHREVQRDDEDLEDYSEKLRVLHGKAYPGEREEYSRTLRLHFAKTLYNKKLGKKIVKMAEPFDELVYNQRVGKMVLKTRTRTFSELVDSAVRLERACV